MWVLILLDGMPTSSWYAELAFRMRVSMSAIGSVMVMVAGAFLAVVPRYGPAAPAKSCTVTSCSW